MIPRAWTLYRAFCLAMVLLNIAVMLFALKIPEFGPEQYPEISNAVWNGISQLLIILGIFLTIGNALLPFLPRNPVTYSIHLANLIMSSAGIIFAPLCLPLIGMFRAAEVQSFFGIHEPR